MSNVDNNIEVQQKKTQAASDELKEASNSYEMTPFNGMSQDEVAVLERRVEKLTAEYQMEKAKLQYLYARKKSLEEKKWSVPTDIFKRIYLKCIDILPIVGKYHTDPVEIDKEQSVPIDPYLSMTIVAAIHELCNGRLFEDMSAIDFYNTLNLHQGSKYLEVRRHEKVRVWYTINQLSERINSDRRNEWIEAMLVKTGIKPDYYRSKYRDPVSDLTSNKNKEFTEALKEVLG
ncbi:MAG: hypothetical protein HDQ88_01835 [Clostridia bacterium]|nr:hypothetical protein [Clostridia bacterium]